MGPSTEGAPRADGALDSAGDRGPQDSPIEVACSNRAPTPETTTTVGAVASEAVPNDGSPAPEAGAMTLSMVGEAAVGSPTASTSPSAGASSPHPQMGAATTSAAVDYDIVEELEVLLGIPFLRDPRDASLNEAMWMDHWVLNQA
jgi:hypothetical protein